MAKLSYQEYTALPNSSFAYVKEISEAEAKKWPSKNIKRTKGKIYLRRFPDFDKSHKRNALVRLAQSKTGGSSAMKSKVSAKVRKKLGNEKRMSEAVAKYR